MPPDDFAPVNHCIDPVKREYTLIPFRKRREIGGRFFSKSVMAPAPLPSFPWHKAQLFSYSILPRSRLGFFSAAEANPPVPATISAEMARTLAARARILSLIDYLNRMQAK